MPKEYVHTNVDGQRIKLSNLDKVLYPGVGVTKAEIIHYYLFIAPYLLPHLANRALTVIRYPDGINGTSFYSKEKPDWTPDWVKSVDIQHEDGPITYVQADNRAALAWLANLACLELHPMQYVYSSSPCPDYFVFDLDPDETLNFEAIKDVADKLRRHLIKYDYTPFIKTSGGKGLHIFVPIKTKYTFDQMIRSVKNIAKEFVQLNASICTLDLPKAKRKGKILIDIYRNHRSQTTVAPYSLRGKSGAPVSMPFHWELLNQIDNAKAFRLGDVRGHLEKHGDAWLQWRDFAAELHDLRESVVPVELDNRLKSYVEKRDLQKSPEPAARVEQDQTDAYVIQWHDASNLHYDLRLEDKGVLLSWALPKGLPFLPEQKRLAIRTEDHPIDYLTFEGEIPEGQYGAGQMFIFDRGQIKWTKKTESSYVFSMSGDDYGITYNLFKTNRDEHWMMTCDVSRPAMNWSLPIGHMLADATNRIPDNPAYSFEVKWDGIRVFIYLVEDGIRIYSRNGNELTNRFPELQVPDVFDVEEGIFDGEIVVLDAAGCPVFADVISRMHSKSTATIERGRRDKPAVCYLFDMVRVDGRDISRLPLHKRRGALKTAFSAGEHFRFSSSFTDGNALLKAVAAKGMEGVMAKDKMSVYHIASRSASWLKIKCRYQVSCFVIGYTKGKGHRGKYFGSFHVAQLEDERWIYRGKVGTGYDFEQLIRLDTIFKRQEVVEKYIEDKIEQPHETTWIAPQIQCEIKYASLTPNGTFREPVYVKIIEE